MPRALRFGFLLPTRECLLEPGWEPHRIIAMAATAERLGFASVWVGEQLARRRLEALTTLAAVAAVTERVALGTAALLPAIHQPLLTAQAISSLDRLSRGRVVVGVGAGFPERSRPEFTLTGAPYSRRYERMGDTVRLWRALWSAKPPEAFNARTLHLDQLPDIPPPHQAGGPPVWLASATPASLERAGQLYDGWLPYVPSPAEYAAGIARVRDAAMKAGRDPASVTPGLFATVLIGDVEESHRTLEHYCRAFYGAPLDLVAGIQLIAAGPGEAVAARLAEFAEAGARHVVLRIGSLHPGDQLERVAEAVSSLAAPGR
jgi:alkanesulfonate monooxygenase SsuD/methylene tetrahydromethanopterin reductase-like flavin-dependent oxidoreductase (luciferase family)